MQTFNAILSAVFDLLLGWAGPAAPFLDIVVWSVAGGIVALLVYKLISNQAGIERAKNGIKVHLLEIRLFQDDILGVLASTGKILLKNALYLGHNVLPMLVMFVPMMALGVQLVAHHGAAPLPPGSTAYLTLTLDREAAPDLKSTDVRLEVPPGVTLAAQVPAPHEVVFKLTDLAEGDHVLVLHLGTGPDAERLEKRLAVGGEPRKVPVLRTKGWEGFLYPAEAPPPAGSACKDLRLPYPASDLSPLPGGEGGVILTFFVLSLAAGIALKGVFGVTL